MLDLRFFARRKTLAAVAILTMALALGANTAALSVVKAFLISGLGIPEPERLLLISPERELPGRGKVIFNEAYANYDLLERTQQAFASVATLLQVQSSWRDGAETRSLDASRVTASFFATMRVQPIIGRAFAKAEEGPSPAKVVVISHALWQNAFGGDAAVIGRAMSLDGDPHTIVGVMPAGFSQPLPTDIWLPFDLPAQQRAAVTGGRILSVYGRVADGKTLEQARADVQRFEKLAIQTYPADNQVFAYKTQPLREVLLNNAGSTAVFVQVGAATLLALAVLNLASLLIAWGFERQQEMAVRVALGAGGRQVTRLLMQQSLIIVGAGAALGIPLAYAALRTLQRYDFGRTVTIFVGRAQIDVAVLLSTALIALLSGLIAGAVPAWFARRDVSTSLRSSSRSSTLSAAAVRWQKAMVIGQAGLSAAILAASVLIGLSFWRLMDVPDGFTSRNRVVARIVLPDATYGRHGGRAAFGARLAANLAAQPELASSGFSTTLPVSDVAWGGRFFPEQADGSTQGDPLLFHFRRISTGYFATMGIPLLRGRNFTAADDTASQQVLIVSRALADRMWPGEDAVGKRLVRAAASNAAPTLFTVIGVVGNTMDGGYSAPPGETVYVAYSQVSSVRISIVAEPRTSRGAAITAVRRAIAQSDPVLAAGGVANLDDLVASANALPRLRTMVLAVFAIVGVGIVLLGSYGVMSQLVSNRERELAVRLLFGAKPAAIGASVIGQVARLTVGGGLLGLAAVWFGSGVLTTFVFGIDSHSPIAFAVAGGALLTLAAVATAPVALRAMRVDIRRGITG